MIEGTKGAMKLAKHRKSKVVEVKDVAFFLGGFPRSVLLRINILNCNIDTAYGITVPGFNAPITTRLHAQFDEKKRRGGAVAPKAVRGTRSGQADEGT
jgi:hypothetical protein